ncbi:helix-turn-helix domain-containing protein [Novosphingobium sp. KN65.2]|uniref:helix-turn-helix domain-containing protein n=1 Tax=Novosphingobium sp. KN65.2 TaxID=1478134 RepID=UPI0005DB67E6|nr:helix-turn-helix domain-containing protein [Novosphingobium sp. KN65.2]CDO36026.1 Excisionase [Novosphingobium sp. KN65.2]
MSKIDERVLAMTVNEACIALSLGRSSIQKLINTGQLRAVKIGGSTRIPTSSIRKLIGEGEAA